jgi:hypothetical protein
VHPCGIWSNALKLDIATDCCCRRIHLAKCRDRESKLLHPLRRVSRMRCQSSPSFHVIWTLLVFWGASYRPCHISRWQHGPDLVSSPRQPLPCCVLRYLTSALYRDPGRSLSTPFRHASDYRHGNMSQAAPCKQAQGPDRLHYLQVRPTHFKAAAPRERESVLLNHHQDSAGEVR